MTYLLIHFLFLPSIALILLPFYGPQEIRYRNLGFDIRVKRILGNPSGQTWGPIVFFQDRGWNRKDLQVHEDDHKYLGLIFGVLFAIAYIIAGLTTQARAGTLRNPRQHFYKENYFERRARAKQNAWLKENV